MDLKQKETINIPDFSAPEVSLVYLDGKWYSTRATKLRQTYSPALVKQATKDNVTSTYIEWENLRIKLLLREEWGQLSCKTFLENEDLSFIKPFLLNAEIGYYDKLNSYEIPKKLDAFLQAIRDDYRLESESEFLEEMKEYLGYFYNPIFSYDKDSIRFYSLLDILKGESQDRCLYTIHSRGMTTSLNKLNLNSKPSNPSAWTKTPISFWVDEYSAIMSVMTLDMKIKYPEYYTLIDFPNGRCSIDQFCIEKRSRCREFNEGTAKLLKDSYTNILLNKGS